MVVEKTNLPIVIFDDVLTTGSQMVGSFRRLAHAGMQPILGLVVGRATKDQSENMIGWAEEHVPVEAVPIDLDAIFNQIYSLK